MRYQSTSNQAAAVVRRSTSGSEPIWPTLPPSKPTLFHGPLTEA